MMTLIGDVSVMLLSLQAHCLPIVTNLFHWFENLLYNTTTSIQELSVNEWIDKDGGWVSESHIIPCINLFILHINKDVMEEV